MGDASCYPLVAEIPVDFKLRKSLTGDAFTVRDSQGCLAFQINRSSSSSSSSRHVKALFDDVGNPLITVVHSNDEWQGFRGNSQEEKDLIFTVKKKIYSPFDTELHVFLPTTNLCDQYPSFWLKGNPFRRACTIIRGNSIVAQTNLLYKLRKIIYSRNKFRLTVYPGNDNVLVLAMLMAFFWRFKVLAMLSISWIANLTGRGLKASFAGKEIGSSRYNIWYMFMLLLAVLPILSEALLCACGLDIPQILQVGFLPK